MVSIALHGMLPFPAQTAIVFEAIDITTEKRAHHTTTRVARGVLEVGVYLYTFRKLTCLYLHVASLHCFHVVLRSDERHAARSDGVLVPVRIDSSVHDPSEQIIHHSGQCFCSQQPVETSHEDCRVRVETRCRPENAVGVGLYPGDDLYLFVAHAATGDLEVEVAALGTLRGAGLQERADGFFVVENKVDVSFRGVTMVLGFLAGPFDRERSELFEGSEESFFSDVPGHAAQKDLGGVDWVPIAA